MGNSQPARIEIRETESAELLFEQAISKSAPKLVFSSAFTNKSGDMIVDFAAQDPDGDPLKIIAQYIEPDGRKQVMFHTRGRGSDKFTCDPCTWPGRTLRGGDGLVRIFASDGLQTTMVERAVKVPDKAPEVSIVATQHGLVDEDGFAVIGLRAEVYDAEGHPPKEVPVLTWAWGEKNRACESLHHLAGGHYLRRTVDFSIAGKCPG